MKNLLENIVKKSTFMQEFQRRDQLFFFLKEQNLIINDKKL